MTSQSWHLSTCLNLLRQRRVQQQLGFPGTPRARLQKAVVATSKRAREASLKDLVLSLKASPAY